MTESERDKLRDPVFLSLSLSRPPDVPECVFVEVCGTGDARDEISDGAGEVSSLRFLRLLLSFGTEEK